MKFALRILFLLVFVSPNLIAQSANVAEKSFEIPRVSQAPQLDGALDPGEWSEAAVVEDFHESRPVEYSDPEARTVFYLMYTEDALYAAVHVYDDPDTLNATTLRHGASLRNDDRIYLLLDPFNNKRSGYLFQTNPNGVRYEALFTGANSLSTDWTGIWNTEAQVVEDGWTAEIRIPFKTVTFDPENDTWGVNFYREQQSSQTRMAWVSRNGDSNPNNAGVMSGISGINQGMGLDVTPSMSAVYVDNARGNFTDSEVNPSLDATYKLTPSLNLTVTLNTDFAATEVDDIQLDLGRFSSRLSEKRSFFLTDMDIFAFAPRVGGFRSGATAGQNGPDPFFSRNIGLNGGTPVDLVGGAKLSGRVGGFDVGTLVIRQDEFEDVDPTNIFVARVKRSVLEESELGVIYTNGDPGSNDSTSTMGVDFTYRNNRLPNNRSIDAQFWIQKSDNPGIDSDDMAWNAFVNLPSNDSWFASARVQEVQENYDPRLGFSNRGGVRQYAVAGGYNWIFRNHPWIQQNRVQLTASRYDYLDTGDLQSSEVELTLSQLTTNSGDEFTLSANREKQVIRPGDRAPLSRLGVVIPPDEYSFSSVNININTSGARPFDVRLRSDYGDYYTGTKFGVTPVVSWRPNRHLSFSLDYNWDRYEMPDATVYTRVAKFTNEIVFTPALSVVNIVQYENVSDSLGFNSRFRWNIQPGQDIYFVLGHNMIDQDEDGDFSRVETSASFKLSYTLRY